MFRKPLPWEDPYAQGSCSCGWTFLGPYFITADQISTHHDGYINEVGHNMVMETAGGSKDMSFFFKALEGKVGKV